MANFPSQKPYSVYYDERKYELLPVDYQESSDELKVGDWVVFIGESSTLKKGDITTITFYEQHQGVIKVMTPELDEAYPLKSGWCYLKDFRKATAEEIQSVISKKSIETFKLPEKWCVKRTDDNCEVLNKWCNSQPSVFGTSSRSGYIHSHNYGSVWEGFLGGHYHANHKLKHPDHTEITFEQFKQYVLKENPIYEKPLTPEECFNPNDPTDIVIPKLTKPVVKTDFTISNKLMDIDIPLNVKPVKHVKPITINKFSLTI